jgi:hypothetical protein
MIIDNSYFIDEIFIPHAKPGITDEVTAIGADITSFIDTYSREALVKCLGYALFKEFSAELDATQPNGLKVTAAAKWDKLLNGTEYTDQNGKLVEWQGIRYKSKGAYNKSFLADYTYYFYEKSSDDDRTGVGNVKQVAKNAVIVGKTPKVIAAWRRFFKYVQGEAYNPVVIVKRYDCIGLGGIGIDWYGQGEFVSLYKFILDANKTDPTTYKDFNPYIFKNENQFGI